MIRTLVAALFAASFALPAIAAEDHSHHMQGMAAVVSLSDGVIKKIDAAKGSVTIAHGPLQNLGMSPMTMSFKADPAALGKLKVGDKVRFLAEDKKGVLSASRFEVVK